MGIQQRLQNLQGARGTAPCTLRQSSARVFNAARMMLAKACQKDCRLLYVFQNLCARMITQLRDQQLVYCEAIRIGNPHGDSPVPRKKGACLRRTQQVRQIR